MAYTPPARNAVDFDLAAFTPPGRTAVDFALIGAPPVSVHLSSPTGVATAGSKASGTVSTDVGNGTLYWLATTNASESIATVKAGSSQAVAATGVQNVLVTGLTPDTQYYLHFTQTTTVPEDAAVVSSAAFTTAGTQLLLSPEAFDNAAWATFSSPTVTANVENDPNGNATVDNVNLGQDLRQHIASLPAGTYTLSAYVKSGPATAATAVRFTTNNALAWNTGISQKNTLSTTLTLYSTTFTLASTQALAIIIGAVDATGAADGTITGNFRIAWAMLNEGSVRGDFVPVDPPAGGSYTLTAAAGAYTLTGVAATLQRNKLLTAVSGAYTLSGIAATLRRNKLLSGAAGAYALSGVSATLAKSKALPAATGSYAVGGIAATLAKSRILAAAQGSYVFTGVAATLSYQPLVGYTLAASAGAYTLAGVSALFSRSSILQATPGAYSLAGVAATLSYQPVSARTLDAAAGAYTLNGQNASFDYSGGTISAQVREVEWRFNNPLLQRIKDANARRVKPARKAARKIAVAIEYEAAELALSGGGEDKFRELLRTWTLQKPVINDPGVDIEQLFMAQVALKLESVQNQLIKRAAEDEEDSIIAILLAI